MPLCICRHCKAYATFGALPSDPARAIEVAKSTWILHLPRKGFYVPMMHPAPACAGCGHVFGEDEDGYLVPPPQPPTSPEELGRLGGLAAAARLTPSARKERASKASLARWQGVPDGN